jgi:hypothetical protein
VALWFAFFKRFSRRRRYRAALAVLVALHAYDRLTLNQQASVEEELAAWYRRFSEFPYSVVSKQVDVLTLASLRAFAMARLGLSTGVPGHTWADLLPFWWRRSPGMLALAFQRFHPGTGDALAYLSAKGIQFPSELGLGPEWLATMKATYP